MTEYSNLDELFSSIPGNDFQEKLNHLALCNCCERHQFNKPDVWSPEINIPFNYTQQNSCLCDCRHTARWICRQCPDSPRSICTDIIR